PFRSVLVPTAAGARLEGETIDPQGPGWALVSGEAAVSPAPAGRSRIDYAFDITVHLRLPRAERWGERALTRMIQFTARTVLAQVAGELPKAVARAAGVAAVVAHRPANRRRHENSAPVGPAPRPWRHPPLLAHAEPREDARQRLLDDAVAAGDGRERRQRVLQVERGELVAVLQRRGDRPPGARQRLDVTLVPQPQLGAGGVADELV